ncbi:hypothetical protein [Bacillus cereus]|nr:hypothetical protein [Bacillus cereus]
MKKQSPPLRRDCFFIRKEEKMGVGVKKGSGAKNTTIVYNGNIHK